MDRHVKEYYYCPSADETPKGNYHTVIALHDAPDVNWSSLQVQGDICKGWFELAQLPSADRIEFTREYWMLKMPYHHKLEEGLARFFNALDDIGIYLLKKKIDDPFEGHFIYSIKNNRGFFRGFVPATAQQLDELKCAFPNFILPNDYLTFLNIHNGFSKATDMTGLISSQLMPASYSQFQQQAEVDPPITTRKGKAVNPHLLLPFYESFGLPYFQCFWEEWYPDENMGNVYYSGDSRMISDIDNEDEDPSNNMSFPSFTDWLLFYLEIIV